MKVEETADFQKINIYQKQQQKQMENAIVSTTERKQHDGYWNKDIKKEIKNIHMLVQKKKIE